jgi:hypothetical protein
MRRENRPHVEREHCALDLLSSATHFAELPHRPAYRCRLENARPLTQICIATPDAMGLLGRVDQQKEECECPRGHGALLDRQSVDSVQEVFEGCGIGLSVTPGTRRDAELLDDLK